MSQIRKEVLSEPLKTTLNTIKVRNMMPSGQSPKGTHFFGIPGSHGSGPQMGPGPPNPFLDSASVNLI
jgi:hypothetical protein